MPQIFKMSRKESCNRTAENSGEEDDKDEKEEQGEEKEEEDFYDCQETLKPPDAQKEEPGDCSTTPEIRKDKDEDQEGESAGNRQQDDSDSEFQEQQVEFDDDYLREAEKDLTDEEKKVTLVCSCVLENIKVMKVISLIEGNWTK